ncbi:GNAT family N-acetyltransferase [Nocardia harenae]|uniref:GNAT family N-acetyltransferase n=1 Tax=Nocardia harenae TaxID=358707 RepID=UPI000AADA59C|nr:GNAT family N-acetyltransferase [Nocardia harenae]
MTRCDRTRELRWVGAADPLVRPLLDELAREYETRYGPNDEMGNTDPADFEPPDGGLVLLLEDEGAVAGGGFRRIDESTAEVKRVWTHSAHRRRGHARTVLVELERAAADAGYRMIRLTTGPRQPEAVGLYLSTGYEPKYDMTTDPATLPYLTFEKVLEFR